MARRDGVLLSWLAWGNDPFERERSGRFRSGPDGTLIAGPTLAFLFDEESDFRGRVGHVVMAMRDDETSRERVEATFAEIRQRDATIRCESLAWSGDDPTDHAAIFRFMRTEVPKLRRRFAGRELLVHTSPGTPSMATIWVLMGETGFIAPPFRLLKSLRPGERAGRGAVQPVQVGIETFYTRYRKARPAETSGREQRVFWDPEEFRSDGLRRLYDEARRVARLRAPVLILGERGTGKTTLAGWIRFQSPFRKKKQDRGWPAVACGQYQSSTMRAELFGYRKGAFTGADRDREGLLARADGDSLFLDEVGDLARDTQRLLIKAVEERRFQPLGSTEWTSSTFRLLTATNVPLGELRGRLDQDFFDRIAVLRLRVPPLREVPEELPWLWREVWGRVLREAGIDLDLGEEHHDRVGRYLAGQVLPGNVRDLFALAWRLLARWPDGPPAGADLASWLSTALDVPDLQAQGELPRDVASRFAAGTPLDDLVLPGAVLPTREIQQALQRWLAQEVRRVARSRSVKPETLVDVTAKTLREWLKGN